MANTLKYFVGHDLNSEIAVSTGVAATAMEDGFSGIVNISPFACLIGRVIEGLFTPWARDQNYPTISVEIDGNLLPPSLVNKLNIFMVNVLRFRGEQNLADLVDAAGATQHADIYIQDKDTAPLTCAECGKGCDCEEESTVCGK